MKRTINERWLHFVVRGEGLRKSATNARYSYVGPIYYSNGYPVARLMMMPGGDYACLNKWHIHPQQPFGWKDDGGAQKTLDLRVPCVGAFSSYDGDWLTDAQLHERLRNLWLIIADAQVTSAKETQFPLLVRDPGSSSGRQANLRRMLKDARLEYEKYGAAFQLGWPSFPTIYEAEFESVIVDRARAYYSDVEVKRRERKLARAGAKLALGLD
jgi:hypothetical protein